MFGLILIPLMFGLAFGLSGDDGDDGDDPEVREIAEEDGDTVELRDDEDVYIGSDEGVVVQANAFDNLLVGNGGDDTVLGGDGDDVIDGGTGDDVQYGQEDDDTIYNGEGDDRIFMGAGDDVSNFLTVTDTTTMQGDDFVRGGAGDDIIVDVSGSNTMFGDVGDDALLAIDGLRFDESYDPKGDFGSADTLNGGVGNDVLTGDDGDEMTGGTGDDDFVVVTDTARVQDTVQITDFDTQDDVLTLFSNGGMDQSVTFRFDSTSGGVVARVEDEDLAVLQGLVAADIPDIQVELLFY